MFTFFPDGLTVGFRVLYLQESAPLFPTASECKSWIDDSVASAYGACRCLL